MDEEARRRVQAVRLRQKYSGLNGHLEDKRYVYFVGADGCDLVKIGWTMDVRRRMADLQCGSPIPLKCLKVTRGGRGLESHLHAEFAPERRHGEWFYLTERLQKLMEALPWAPGFP